MKWAFRAPPRVFFLFLLALLILPGDGNQGSVTGSCFCERIISDRQITPRILAEIRKQLKAVNHCFFFVRFQLQSVSVCGESKAQWARDLVSCFARKECGNGHRKSFHHQERLPQASTRVPEPTDGTAPDTSTPAQALSTQPPPLPSGTPSWNEELTHYPDTTTLTSSYGLQARPEAKANAKQKEDTGQESPGAEAGTTVSVVVLSLLATVLLLTVVLVCVFCNRRQVTRQRSADFQLFYKPVNQDPGA
ncbi:C-X-C motif chemokine 16 [Acomys russatus]|uniref:C-X-C motif chemokine 16 n=1 Tax=Acomys russatus TaxID=60746 RepID=UPI0021E255D3|nr:C-X-C motif chemokine 16 [Acomys russatus]